MRFRPIRCFQITALLCLIAASGCDSDDPVAAHETPATPVWSELTNLLPRTTLYGMWAPRADLVMAVGRSGQIWQWDGQLWTQRVSNSSAQDLFSIAGSATGSVIAVGDDGAVLEQVQGVFVLRDAGTSEDLHGIWRSSSGTFVAVGDAGIAVRGSGTAWSTDTTPTRSALLSVWGTADGDIFAVGVGGVILHYDGVEWTSMESGTTEVLTSVSGTSPADVYAAGLEGSILHYDGVSWQQATGSTTGPLQSVCADCGPTAVGANGKTLRMIDGVWQHESVGSDRWLYAVARAGTDVWAVGAHALYRHDGVAWSSETRGTVPILRAITSTRDDGLIVGGDNGVVMLDGPDHWRFEDAGALMRLNAAWTSPSGEILAAGTNHIFRYEPDGWVAENNEAIEYFDIGGNDEAVFAVGAGGQIRRRAGTAWTPYAGPGVELHAIYMSESDAYIAGNNGNILYLNSNGWQVKFTRAGAVLWDIARVESTVWKAIAVGAGGLCLGRSIEGDNWVPIETTTTATLSSLATGPGEHLYAVGSSGTVLRFVNDRWETLPSPTSRTFLRAWSRNGALFVCGGTTATGGLVFRYGPPNP